MTLFITLFVTSFIVALSGAVMPGPLLTVTISETSRRGLMTGPLLIVGHAVFWSWRWCWP
jgi:threonine/homoserine/homoserine lactone efflux protein